MLEDSIRDAIIDKFFEPTTLVVTHPVFDSHGNQRIESYTTQTDPPMMHVAKSIYEANKEAILAAVMLRLDIDAIVDQCSVVITKAVVEKLTAPSGNNWMANPSPSERAKMLEKVYEMVAEEFGRQCVEHLRQTGGLMGILEAPKEAPDESNQR